MKNSLALLLVGTLLFAGSAALGQSFADPTGEALLGLIDKSAARGQKLTGVLFVEFVGIGTGSVASSARVTVRLSQGSHLAALFGETGPVDTDVPQDVQAAIIDALDAKLKGEFFPASCGTDGLGCPSVRILLKGLDKFALTDDGVLNQIVVTDISIAMSAPL